MGFIWLGLNLNLRCLILALFDASSTTTASIGTVLMVIIYFLKYNNYISIQNEKDLKTLTSPEYEELHSCSAQVLFPALHICCVCMHMVVSSIYIGIFFFSLVLNLIFNSASVMFIFYVELPWLLLRACLET